jgi:hypothetical protein
VLPPSQKKILLNHYYIITRTMRIVAAKSLLARTLAPPTVSTGRAFIHVGDQIPNVDLHKGFPPEMVNLRDYCKGTASYCGILLLRCAFLSLTLL